MSAEKIYAKAFFDGLRPDPTTTVSDWADRHRILTTTSSSAPGPWRTSRTPYLKEVMDCLSPSSPVETVVLMKGAQTGGSEAGNNWIGFTIHLTPGPILMVQPTTNAGEAYSKQRIDKMIEASEVLRDRVHPPRSRDSGNTLLLKDFPGGFLKITGAESATGLRSTPIRFLFLDEVDNYTHDADGEGDPVDLAIERTANFPNRKIFMVSTPLIKGFSRIEKAYEESDQRRYDVPCPHCLVKQPLLWKQIKFLKGKRDQAWYECLQCGEVIPEHKKMWMLANGEWFAQNPGNGLIAGFHLSSLYSPWTSWAKIAVEHGKVYKDPARLKVWVNTKLGETWEESFEKLDSEGFMARREDFGILLPPGVVFLTMGVDVQRDRLELEIVGWGRDEESWSIKYIVIPGDPTGRAVWEDLDRVIHMTFPHSRQVDDLPIFATAIDTGGSNTQQAYQFCQGKIEERVWGIKGMGGMGRPIWPLRASRNTTRGVPIFIIGVDAAKESIYARLRISEPGQGYCHFPLDSDAEYFRQLTVERVATTYRKGRPVRTWVKPDRARNEALDCRVYAMAAAHGVYARGFNLGDESDWIESFPLKEGVEQEDQTQGNTITNPKIPMRQIVQGKAVETKRSKWLGGSKPKWLEPRR
ncbi:MAG: phage terminase large subunit family protein [Nitrospirae bacterium]|nr:phage terminase large subunit family protein [Magnetococcales bacterium]